LDKIEKIWIGNNRLAGNMYLLPFIFMAKETLEEILVNSFMIFDNSHNLFISLLPKLKRITYIDDQMMGLLSLVRLNNNVETIDCFIGNSGINMTEEIYKGVDLFVERLNFITENIKELILPFKYSDALQMKMFFPNLKTMGVREFHMDLYEVYENVIVFDKFLKMTQDQIREDWLLS